MKKNRSFLNTFLITFLFIAIPYTITTAQNAAYQNSYPIAAYLLDYAKKLYEQGDFENAKHEFSKLLVIDPDNKEAREYLKKMGLDRGLYRSTGRLGLEEGSIYRENLDLRGQNAKLTAAIADLRQDLAFKSSRLKNLEEEFNREKENFAARLAEYENRICALENLLNAKNQALANLHEELRRQRIEGELRSSVRDGRLEEELSNSGRFKGQLEEYTQKINELENTLASKEGELANLSAELESYRKSAQNWQDIKQSELEDKSYALERLKNEFDALQLKFTQSEKDNLE
jgi:chromosome segregation ATPase